MTNMPWSEPQRTMTGLNHNDFMLTVWLAARVTFQIYSVLNGPFLLAKVQTGTSHVDTGLNLAPCAASRSMWLGGCGKHATDRTKHKAKEVTKGVAAGEQMFKACPGNTQCLGRFLDFFVA